MSDDEEPVEEEPVEEEAEAPAEDVEGGDGDGEGGVTEDGGGGGAGPCGQLLLGCVAFPLALFLLGWNELDSFCTAKQIAFADQQVQPMDCDVKEVAKDSNVFFSCPVDKDSFEKFSAEDFLTIDNFTFDPPIEWDALAGVKTVMYYGCEETSETASGGGGSGRRRESKTKYKYAKKWLKADTYRPPSKCDDAKFVKEAKTRCGNKACEQPVVLDKYKPLTLTTWAEDVKAGFFRFDKEILEDNKLQFTTRPEGEPFLYDQESCKTNLTVGNCFRADFQSIGEASTFNHISYVGKAKDDSGGLTKIVTPAEYVCSESTFSQLYPQELTKEEMFEKMNSDNMTKLWVLRAIGMFLAICGINCCLSPIASAADSMGDMMSNLPCCGEALDDAITGVVGMLLTAISCAVGCSCSLLVIAVFQLVLNPLIGAGMLAVVVCCCVGAVVIRKQAGVTKKEKKQAGEAEMANPYAAQSPMQQPVQQPMYDQQQQMQQPMMQQQPMMGQPMMGQPMMQQQQPMMQQPMMGQPMMQQQMMGQPMMQQQPMMGQPMMGQPMMGQPMMGQPMNQQ